jgi:DNA-binding MarR family transcriptional regulator
MSVRAIVDDAVAGWVHERPDLDFEVMGTFLRLAQVMRLGARGLESALAVLDLTLGEFDVLAALRRNGAGAARTPSYLARVSMVSPGGMTNRLDRLERAGLIARRPDPSDRRGSLVSLTAAGTRRADAAIEAVVAGEEHLAAGISAAERVRLDRILDKLLARLDEAEAAAHPPG